MSPADKARAEIDRLIEKLESLESFHAEYKGHGPEGDATLVLEYEAPGNARLQWLDGEKRVHEVIIVDGVMATRPGDGVAADDRSTWRVDLHAIFARWTGSMAEALRANAPALAAEFSRHSAATTFGPRFYMGLQPPREDEGTGARLDVGLRYEVSKCSAFHWLCALRKHADQLVLNEEYLSLEIDEAVLRISAATGFVQEYARGSGEDRRGFELARLLLDDAVPAGGIVVPDDVPEAPDEMKRSLHASFVGLASFSVTDNLGRDADDGRIEWSAENRASLASALHAYFVDASEFLAGDYVDGQTKRIDERADSFKTWVENQRERGRDPEELRDEIRLIVEDTRMKLESSLEEASGEIIGAIFSAALPPANGGAADAREIARDSAMKAWEESAARPVLAHFEAKFVEPWTD